jgi:hypothetical protein
LKESTRPVPASQCGHRYFSGVLDSFIKRNHYRHMAGSRATRAFDRQESFANEAS